MKKTHAVCVLLALFAALSASGDSSTEKRWVVLFHNQSSIPADAERSVAEAGGTIWTRLPELGVLVATSTNPDFAAQMSRDPKVAEVSEDVRIRLIPQPERMNLVALDAPAGTGPTEPPGDDTQTGSEPFYNAFQWDKRRVRASNQGSYSVQQGRADVVVAVLDTGAQILPTPHPDIFPNLDVARSRSFVPGGGFVAPPCPAPPAVCPPPPPPPLPVVPIPPGGDPNPVAWDDRNGHGSWCLSAVGAPINGIGMSGVAPRVRLVALKVLDDNGDGSYTALAQALVYAGVNRFDVASMSLGGYLPHAGAQALIKMVQRAVNFARTNGVTPIAALGNESFDVADGSFFGPFITVPAEIDGVIGVSATGYFNLKASYSNYGVGKTDISAPGGDYAVQAPGSTYPGLGSAVGAWAPDNTAIPGATYAFASGTSMACPNAAGVCALIISQYGDFTPDNSRKAHMSPQAVESILQRTANNQPCPDPKTVNYFLLSPPFPANTPVPGVFPNQTCQGDAGYNNFYGKGIVDAFKAVTDH